MIAAEACRAAKDVLAANADRADSEAIVAEPSIDALRSSGLLGLLVPEDLGGLGGTIDDFVDIAAELGGSCGSTAMIWAMHCQQVDAILRFGTQTLQHSLLPRVAAGEVLIGSITTERETGGQILAAAAPLVTDEGGTWLDRVGPIVSAARCADAFLVTMRQSGAAAAGEVTLVCVERRLAQIDTCGSWDAIGMRGTESLEVRIRGHVNADQIVGAQGQFRAVVIESFAPMAHVGWTGVWLGIATAAMKEVVSSFRGDRRAVRKLESDITARALGRARGNLELVASFLQSVVSSIVRARKDGASLSAAPMQIRINALKVTASDLLLQSVRDLVDVVGLDGGYVRRESTVLQRCYRDLLSAPLNFRNDRLLVANGNLAILDRAVSLSKAAAAERVE